MTTINTRPDSLQDKTPVPSSTELRDRLTKA